MNDVLYALSVFTIILIALWAAHHILWWAISKISRYMEDI